MAFCTNCGAKLDDNFAFCVSCGAKVNVYPQSGADETPVVPVFPGDSEKPEKKPLLGWLIAVIAGVLVLAIAAVLIFALPGTRKDDSDWFMYTDLDGTVHFIYSDGSVENVEGDYDDARKCEYTGGYVILEDGELYTVNRSMKKRTDITDSCDELRFCASNYIVYIEDGDTVLYDLDRKESFDVKGAVRGYMHYGNAGGDPDAAISDLFFITDKDVLWRFSAEDSETEKVAENTKMEITYCSDDGSLMFYSVLDGATDYLYVWENGKSRELDSVEYDNTYYNHDETSYYSYYAPNAEAAILGNSDSDTFIMVSGNDYEKVNIPGVGFYSAALDGAASLYEYKGEDIPDGVYLTAYKGYGNYEDDMSYVLWYAGFDGKTKEIAETAGSLFAIFGDKIYYFSGEHELSCGTLTGNRIKNSEVVDDGVIAMEQTGDSVYYLTDCEVVDEVNDFGKGTVYRINPELDKPVKVDRKAACGYIFFDNYDGSLFETGYLYWPGAEINGKILTCRDVGYIDKDRYIWDAVLVACDKDGEGSEELERVIGNYRSSFENGNCIFEQYVKTKKGQLVVNVFMYDGKEMKLLLEDVWSRVY